MHFKNVKWQPTSENKGETTRSEWAGVLVTSSWYLKNVRGEAQLAVAHMSCKETPLNRAQEAATPLVECALRPSGCNRLDSYANDIASTSQWERCCLEMGFPEGEERAQEMKSWLLFLKELVLSKYTRKAHTRHKAFNFWSSVQEKGGRWKAESSITSHVNTVFGIKAGLGLIKTLSLLRENLGHEE